MPRRKHRHNLVFDGIFELPERLIHARDGAQKRGAVFTRTVQIEVIVQRRAVRRIYFAHKIRVVNSRPQHGVQHFLHRSAQHARPHSLIDAVSQLRGFYLLDNLVYSRHFHIENVFVADRGVQIYAWLVFVYDEFHYRLVERAVCRVRRFGQRLRHKELALRAVVQNHLVAIFIYCVCIGERNVAAYYTDVRASAFDERTLNRKFAEKIIARIENDSHPKFAFCRHLNNHRLFVVLYPIDGKRSAGKARKTSVYRVGAGRRHIQNKVVIVVPLIAEKIANFYSPQRAVFAHKHSSVYGAVIVTDALNISAGKVCLRKRRTFRFFLVKLIEKRRTESEAVFFIDITHFSYLLAKSRFIVNR